jgi:hypothetical protein
MWEQILINTAATLLAGLVTAVVIWVVKKYFR